MTMLKFITNNWHRKSGESFATSRILDHRIHPEGLDIDRIRFIEYGRIIPIPSVGHIISVLKGSGTLHIEGNDRQPFSLEEHVHLYLPIGMKSIIKACPGTELLQVSGASSLQARGKHLLLRDETFLSACASGSQSLRWIFTPQYLSRRIFLQHDPVLLSKSGNPVSWFRTTMFDVAGLPENEDGDPVFKMSYNSRTECNVCYDVKGTARVRMALHPYSETKQIWGHWSRLDNDSTYHLNEAAGSPDEEYAIDKVTEERKCLRNKHEVNITDGHVTLFCLFDPAPTGIERHQPGEYSDYEPLSQVLKTREYKIYQKEIAKYDEMVDRLSLAKAMGTLRTFHGTPLWELYLHGREAQESIESRLVQALGASGSDRIKVVAPWMQTTTA